jgi:hypothetical protein
MVLMGFGGMIEVLKDIAACECKVRLGALNEIVQETNSSIKVEAVRR